MAGLADSSGPAGAISFIAWLLGLDTPRALEEKAKMKQTQFYIGSALGVACLALSIAAVGLGLSNEQLKAAAQAKAQSEIQAQQPEINKGAMSQQIGKNILTDMAQSAVKNEKMKAILAKNGFNVQVAPETKNESKTEKK